MEKNKKGINKIVFIIFLIIALILGSIGGAIGYKKYSKNENEESKIKNTTTKITTTTKNAIDSKYISTKTTNYTLNDKNYKISFNYYYEENVEKTPGETDLNALYQDIIINDYKLNISKRAMRYFEANELANINDIIDFENEKNNVMTLKGSDKEYLVLALYEDNSQIDGRYFIEFVNSDNKIIKELEFSFNQGISVTDNNKKKLYMEKNYYIEENKFFYLQAENCDTINENSLSINNDVATVNNLGKIEAELVGAC